MVARPADGDELLTPSEVAALFRVDPKTVTRWAKAGKLTSIRTLGGHRRYRSAEVHSLLNRTPGMRPESPVEVKSEQSNPRTIPVRPTIPRPGVPRQATQGAQRPAPRTINLSTRTSEPRT